ncbi:MAG: FtsB family cell division protein [Elusimicrobiota bacterium]
MRGVGYKLIIISFVVIGALVYFSGSNIKNILTLKNEIKTYQKKLEMLKKENKEIEKEINWIKNEEDYIKYLARKKLGLIEPGEIKFYIKEKEETNR